MELENDPDIKKMRLAIEKKIKQKRLAMEKAQAEELEQKRKDALANAPPAQPSTSQTFPCNVGVIETVSAV